MSVAASIYLPQITIGETAFDGFKNEMGKFGNRVSVIHGERAWKASSQYILPALEKAELSVTGTVLYGHEATHRNAERITEDPCVREADMLLAVGGGKCLDTVKLAEDGKSCVVRLYEYKNCSDDKAGLFFDRNVKRVM